MQELFETSFFLINIPYTILFLIMILYWGTVLLGLLSLNSFDFDVEADTEVEVDMEIDTDVSVNGETGVEIETDADTSLDANVEVGKHKPKHSWQRPPLILRILAFFNLGKVPFMIFMSFMAIFMWSGAVLGHHYLGANQGTFAMIWVLPNILAALLITKIFTYPFIPIFKEDKIEFQSNQDVIGKRGKVILPATHSRRGQMNIKGETGVFITINVLSNEGIELKGGSQALVVAYDEERNVYIAEPFDH